MDWATALSTAEAASFAGQSDWRLPNVKELHSLVEECRVSPSINDTVFPGAPSSSNVWSGSPYAGSTNSAWRVTFALGIASNISRITPSHVRLVRGPAPATPPTPVDGACGSASGTASASAPAANLCSTGTATGITGTGGQWQWGCQGSNGGTNTAPNACTAAYANQTLTISASPTSILVGGTSTISASSTASLSVSLAGNANCTVSGSTATGTNAGTCTVTASQAGTGDTGTHRYLAAADKTVNITVNALPTYTITTTASPLAGGSVNCTPNPVPQGHSSICSVTANPGYTFTAFGGDCSGSACTIGSVTAAKSVQAAFSQSVAGLTLPEGPQSGQPLGVQLPPGNGWVIDSATTQTLASLGAPPLPTGFAPHGVVALRLSGGTAGTSATVVLTYPQPLPAGTVYYKYGKTAGKPTAHWYPFSGATISGNTITLTLKDGADGDDDLAENSAITDPGGPVVPQDAPQAAAAIPTLSQWALLLLSALAGVLALGRLRARRV